MWVCLLCGMKLDKKKKSRKESLGLERAVAPMLKSFGGWIYTGGWRFWGEKERGGGFILISFKKIKLFIRVVNELELLDFSPKILDGFFVCIFIGDFDMLEMLK